MKNYNGTRIMMFANKGVSVEWKREDGQLIQQMLTISDYDFLIRKKKGKLLLKPLSELLVEVLPNETELESIIKNHSINITLMRDEHSRQYVFNVGFSGWLIDNIEQAPFELIEVLITLRYDVFKWIQSGDALDVNEHSH